jgi:hypothetical protein
VGGRDAFKAAIRSSLKGLRVCDHASESNTPLPGGRLSAADLHALDPVLRLPGRNATKADVVVYDVAGRRIAVKDYAARPLWVRLTIGRLLVRRECAAYAAAAGIDGLPRFHGRLGPLALALDWIEAEPLAAQGGARLPARVFDALDRIVAACHARGIALGDLHHRDVLVSVRGEVHIVDLATAWLLGARPGAVRRRVFERLRGNDLVACARLRARFTGIPEADALAGVPPLSLRRHARARRVKALWDRLRGRSARVSR